MFLLALQLLVFLPIIPISLECLDVGNKVFTFVVHSLWRPSLSQPCLVAWNYQCNIEHKFIFILSLENDQMDISSRKCQEVGCDAGRKGRIAKILAEPYMSSEESGEEEGSKVYVIKTIPWESELLKKRKRKLDKTCDQWGVLGETECILLCLNLKIVLIGHVFN